VPLSQLLSDFRLFTDIAPNSAPTPTAAPTAVPAEALPAAVVVPSASDRHLLSRFSWGITPALIAEAADAGGARQWLERQLESAVEPDALADWWPHLRWTPAEKLAADQSGEITGYDQSNDFSRWTLIRRMTSSLQLLEVMTDVWSNLLYVSLVRKSFPHRPRYDAAIRANALGTFEDLLTAAILEPAMLCYLDNARSTQKAPNENLGRELLELHTVGLAGGYSERDVRHSTRILTGYRVETDDSCAAYYSPEDHAIGRVHVLDFQHPNTLPDGRGVTAEYLSYLARHEATARRVARVLAVRFVSDTPSESLIETLATAYLDSGTDIPTMLRVLVDHEEFAASTGLKVRTPVEDFVNTYRSMQVKVLPPNGDEDGAAAAILVACASMGQQPFDWPRPDGFPDVGDAWSSASRMLGSWRVHKNTSGGFFPRVGIEYREPEHWIGALPVRFDDLVDRICRLILGKASTEALLATAVRAVDTQPGEIITGVHRVIRWRTPALLLALLDTPDHMTR